MTLKEEFILALVFCIASSTMYTVNMKCGTCKNTTGCAGNTCLIYTGDVNTEYCYGTSTCSISFQQNIQLGLCSKDLYGTPCSSGVCMSSSSMYMCYSKGDSCLNGVRSTMTCSGSTAVMTYSGTGFYTPYTTTTNWGQPCNFQTMVTDYSYCAGDVFGNNCKCCLKMTLTGVSLSTSIGNCVPQTSPIAKVKAQLESAKQADDGNEIFEGFITITLMVLMFVIMTVSA